MPSIMYKLLVSPPAHKGPKMVARPPTERLTPWLNPFVEASQRTKGYFFNLQIIEYRWKRPQCNGFIALHMLSSNLLNRAHSAQVK